MSQTHARRRQLSLWVPPDQATALEAARRVLDPVQQRLIPAHVTVCRDDEVPDLDVALLRARLNAGRSMPLQLHFGPAQPFHTHGWLLPCVQGQAEFQALRVLLLGRDDLAQAQPHITLAHPRNPRAVGNTPEQARSLPTPRCLVLPTLQLIEQRGAQAWGVLAQFALAAPLSKV
jgi:hypothetical protein